MKTTGIGTRVLNFVIDTFIIFLLAFLFFKIHQRYVYYYRVMYLNFGWFFFGTLFIFYFLFEFFFRKTPGKWFTQTRVVTKKGTVPTAKEIFIRSICRLIIIDMFFIPFLDAPLHDYVSKTTIVEE